MGTGRQAKQRSAEPQVKTPMLVLHLKLPRWDDCGCESTNYVLLQNKPVALLICPCCPLKQGTWRTYFTNVNMGQSVVGLLLWNRV